MSNVLDYKLPSTWCEKPLIELISNNSTITYGVVQPGESVEGGVPFVRGGDIYNGKISIEKLRTVSSEISNTYKRTLLQGGELLMSLVGYPGEVALVPVELSGANIARQAALIKLSSNVHNRYVMYYLLSEIGKFFLFQKSTGSAQQVINLVELKEVNVLLPPFEDQKKIAKVLNTIDNLIDQTQNLIDKYTAVKQGMMADLFSRGIDLSGTADTNKNYGQLRPSFDDAPELYQETELGWVPDGWEIVTLESIATVERGKFTHRPRDDAKCYGGLHPFIQTGSVTKSQGGFITEYKQTLSDFGRNVSKEFPKGTIAVTIAANIADTGILNIPMCFPDSVVGVVVNNEFSTTRFVEISIRRNKRRLDALAPLSAQKNINLEDLRPLKIALPNIEEQKELCRRYETQESLIQKEKEYLEKLKLKKKGLMQDLLTGKVKV